MKPRTTVALALFAATLAVQAAPNMQAGLWEVTTKMDMPGLPAGMGQTTVRQCVRPADLEDPKKTIPQDDKCQVKDYRLQGNTASWRIECKGKGAMTGSGTITYGGNSYSGTTKMSIKEGGQSMNMAQTFSAKRIGDCK
ncbi:MAG: hypothetical protein A2040_08265 [Rhodocyclales bacterium GWA2_65_19]|nr:MAG: hypothetical protein A2040_08265 [Rhodocyclales bacterium GWA2_65_19]